jgi:hypothetical protein
MIDRRFSGTKTFVSENFPFEIFHAQNVRAVSDFQRRELTDHVLNHEHVHHQFLLRAIRCTGFRNAHGPSCMSGLSLLFPAKYTELPH